MNICIPGYHCRTVWAPLSFLDSMIQESSAQVYFLKVTLTNKYWNNFPTIEQGMGFYSK